MLNSSLEIASLKFSTKLEILMYNSIASEDRGASAKSILQEGNSLLIEEERCTCRSEFPHCSWKFAGLSSKRREPVRKFYLESYPLEAVVYRCAHRISSHCEMRAVFAFRGKEGRGFWKEL